MLSADLGQQGAITKISWLAQVYGSIAKTGRKQYWVDNSNYPLEDFFALLFLIFIGAQIGRNPEMIRTL